MTQLRKTCTCNQAHVPRSNNSNFHGAHPQYFRSNQDLWREQLTKHWMSERPLKMSARVAAGDGCYNRLVIVRVAMKTLNRITFLLLGLACFLSQATAQARPAASEAALPRTVIYAGHLLDVKTGRMINNAIVVIQGDRIVSVGSSQDIGTPAAGTKEIHLANTTLVPGLIDAHTHITFDPNFGYQELGISIPKEALIGANNARITLEAGFPTIRNVGPTHAACAANSPPTPTAPREWPGPPRRESIPLSTALILMTQGFKP